MTPSALFTRHRNVAHAIARNYRVPGADPDDVQQEALIALWEAAGAYQPGRGASFKTFAGVVIHRRLQDAVRNQTRLKRYTPEETSRLEPTDPRDTLQARADLRAVLEELGSLSTSERRALTLSLNGGKGDHRALYRARRKLKAAA